MTVHINLQLAYTQYETSEFLLFTTEVCAECCIQLWYNLPHKYIHSQNLSFKEQLDAGIRYFDLRVSSKPGEPGKEIYFIHGLFGHKVSWGVITIWYLNAYKQLLFYIFPSIVCDFVF